MKDTGIFKGQGNYWKTNNGKQETAGVNTQAQRERVMQTRRKSHHDSTPFSKVHYLVHKVETSDQGGRRGSRTAGRHKQTKKVQKL